MERLILIGITLILAGFLAVFAGILLTAARLENADVKGGGVVFIGPIPLVFGTDWKSAVSVAILAIILMAAYWLFLGR